MAEVIEKCANCGGTIGKLETPMVWKGEVVCADCHAKLSKAEKYSQSADTDDSKSAEAPPVTAENLLPEKPTTLATEAEPDSPPSQKPEISEWAAAMRQQHETVSLPEPSELTTCRISHNWLWQRIVNFNCPSCSVALQNPLRKAGRSDVCPHCGTKFTTPGYAIVEYELKLKKEKAHRRRLERLLKGVAQDRFRMKMKNAKGTANEYGGTGPVIMCLNPHCGYLGPVKIRKHGDEILGWFMVLFCFLIIGIVYLMFYCYPTYHCAKCGTFLQKA
jgi:predicted RNA-binding Zn-ribbon protein involved in translation (DUF1610 family)